MKQPKKLTREHKEYLKKCDLNPKEWMLLTENPSMYVYINKNNNQILRYRYKHNDKADENSVFRKAMNKHYGPIYK